MFAAKEEIWVAVHLVPMEEVGEKVQAFKK